MPITNQDIQDFNDLKNLYFSKQNWDLEVYKRFYDDFNQFISNINYIENNKVPAPSLGWTIQTILETISQRDYAYDRLFIAQGCSTIVAAGLAKVKNTKGFEFLFAEFFSQSHSHSNSKNKLQFLVYLNEINLEDFETLCCAIGLKHSLDLKVKRIIDFQYELYNIGRDFLYDLFKENVWFWVEIDVTKFLTKKQKVERFLQEYRHITENFREIDINQSILNYIQVTNQNRIEENVLTRDIGYFLSNQGFRDLGLIFEGKTTSVPKGHGRCDIISKNYDFIIESKYFKGNNLELEITNAIDQGIEYCQEHSVKNLYVIIFLSDESTIKNLIEKSETQKGISVTVYCVDIRLNKNPPSKKSKTNKKL